MKIPFTRRKCNLIRNFFYFSNEASSKPRTKTLSKLDLFFLEAIPFYSDEAWMLSASFLPQKHVLFRLKAPKKKMITVKNFSKWDINFESGDLAWKFYFHSLVEVRFQGLFLKTRILWKSDILKRFIFLVSEYGNLTGVKTHCDRLGSLEKTFTNRRLRFSGFERDWGPHKGFRCFLVVDLSFFC